MKTHLIFTLALFSSMVLLATTTTTIDGIRYTIADDGKSCVVSSGQDCVGAVVIPEEIGNGCKVVGIGKNAFYNSSVSSVIIPDSVTRIDDYAFAYCSQLKSLVIPKSVVFLGAYIVAESK